MPAPSPVADEPVRLPRLTVSQLRAKFYGKPGGEKVAKFSLHDLLFGEQILEGIDDDATVVLKPVNFKGLAALERKYGGVANIPASSHLASSPTELIEVLTILVNQDLPADKEKSVEEVGRILSGDKAELVAKAIGAALNPLAVSRAVATTVAGASIGPGSSSPSAPGSAS